MLIFSTLCLLFFMGNTFVLTRGCDTGWFGDKCQYKCHCESTCDISGDCIDHKCSPGWFGYKCQYRDLVNLSKNNINKNRGNIDTKTCIELDSNNDNITLQWDNLYVFTWLRIALNKEISELITDLQILFRQDIKKTVSYVPCQNKLFYVIKPQTIDVRCDFNGTFKELVLKGKTIQSICTFNINGGRNVALKQSTTQSGTYTDRSHTEEYSNSSNAVDGKALYSFKEKSCAHPFSGNRKQFWSVKFPHRVVTGYVLYDRQDGAENFNGFKLTASTGNEIQFEYIDEKLKVPKRIYTIPHPRKSPVSNVTIYRDGTLNVCEVEVYGECPPGTWGLNCSQCTTGCPHNCQVDDGSCEILCPGFSNPPFCNQTCDSGWFGDGCKYKCHCKEKCDTSGYCTNNKCSDGWFGYKCQYRDLMYLVSLEANRVIFDNNDDTCITSKPDSIILRWNEAYVFTWLRIVVKNETFITDLKIQFQKNEKQITQFLACRNQRLYLVDSKTMDVWCDLNDTFHQLTLTGKAVLSLCTLNVNGGRNVALKQNTSQSGTYSNARSKEDAAQSSNAVDGKLDAKYFTFKEKSCSHTAVSDKNPFWSVQFLPHLITEYVLYDRRDHKVENLIGFTLTAFPRTDESFYFQDKNVAVEKKIYRLLDPRKNIVSNVTITRKNFLNICEVEIYGECPTGTWGLACTNCSQDCPNECHVEDGRCVNLCLGFTNPPSCDLPCKKTEYGINCTKHCSDNCTNNECDSQTGECLECSGNGTYSGACDKRCDNSYWGEFCNESCSLNCANQTCDQETGDCNGGCNEGYKPPNCMESCSLGNYGFNCSENCSSQCRNNSGCEPISGECIDGCEDGYAGPHCNRICEDDTYGTACSKNCSLFCLTARNGSRCHHISGDCYGGCTEGYMNPSCNEICTENTFGQNCAQNCSLHCATNNSASRCDHRTGECLVGCVQEYKQPLCLERIPSEGSPLTVILVICIVLLLALIVVVILFKFKDSLLPKPKVQDDGGEQRTGYELVTINTTERQSSAHVTSKETRSKLDTQCESLSRTNLNESYSNMEEVPVQQLPTSISVKDLGLYIYTHNSKFFQDEFKRIPVPDNVTYQVGLRKQNNIKNRYKDIIPYDHSRVHLQALNELEDDYINASYIRDHQNRHKYIATQGPNFVSLNDFIRMLWEQKVEQVVMLTHLDEYSKEKCEQYWPTSGTKEYGTIEVRLTHTKNFTNYIVRYLELVKNQEVQIVTQYHYISWPDHGVPTSPWALVEFEQRVSALKTSTPLVVHCSAGVGRTGTFIALLNIMQQAEQTGQVDIFSTVVKLRQDRHLMVQTAGQYEFLHVAVLAAIACSKATLHTSDIKYLPDNQTLENEYLAVCSVISTLSRRKEEDDNLEDENVDESENVYANFKIDLRNRFHSIVPSDKDRPMLSCEPQTNGDYINAVFLQNFDKKSRHIVTQLPMPITVVEFWRLLSQYNVSVIVAFETDAMVKDKTVSKFAPSPAESALKCGPFKVHNVSYKVDNLWDEQSLQVQSDLSREKVLSVTCLYAKFADLDTRKHVPLLKKLSSYKLQKDQKIVYMCRNGATYSGFLCVLSLLMERLETESSFNVPLIVRATKIVRPDVVPTFSHYKAIYETLASYLHISAQTVKVNNPIFDESQTDYAHIYCNI